MIINKTSDVIMGESKSGLPIPKPETTIVRFEHSLRTDKISIYTLQHVGKNWRWCNLLTPNYSKGKFRTIEAAVEDVLGKGTTDVVERVVAQIHVHSLGQVMTANNFLHVLHDVLF